MGQKPMKKMAMLISASLLTLALSLAVLASDTASCNHQYNLAADADSHFYVCSICGEEQPKEKHQFVDGICTVCEYTPNHHTTHSCTISKANENYHRFACDECENYSRVLHDETTMDTHIKNEWFHVWECKDCGYEYAEKHNFATSYNNEFHQEVCIDCGYEATAEVHDMVNDFYADYHDIHCDECGYMAEHHVGVKYETVDANNCQAVCRCGVVDIIEHDWDGFMCDNCGYAMSGDTYAIVDRIKINSDGEYRVRFIENGGTHTVDMWDVSTFKEGDFVKISHHGNDIFSVTVLVDGKIVGTEENFSDYILSDEIDEKSLVLEDLIIEEFAYNEDCLDITFESGRSTSFANFNEVVVYNLVNNEIGIIEENYAYLTLLAGDTIYFIAFW
ncbi:MAG: hypothetical protein E7314_01715 [Clostridiales bacterium]|nr:hypothetical protein [Clostridiales bacterium]